MYADPRRQLEVLDPTGRELLISVGAAVFTLRPAIRGTGHLRPDDEILADIETGVLPAYLAEGLATVTVAVVGGVVTLAGKVDRRSAADLVVRMVRAVNGVVDVDNQVTFEFDDRDLLGTGIAFGAA